MDQSKNSVKNLIGRFRQELDGMYPEGEISQFIYLLFEAYLGWPKTTVQMSFGNAVPDPEMRLFETALTQLLAGRPVQQVIGQTWFNGLVFKVNGHVLIPRPETEELCLMIHNDFQGPPDPRLSILDIGTGSGCIAIDLKKHFPTAEVTAIDLSDEALAVAKENGQLNNCEIKFVRADILNPDQWDQFGQFDVIVSNPPYIPENERALMHRNITGYEPGTALFVPDENPLLFYRAIAEFATQHLKPRSRLYFEINERFGAEVCELLSLSGFDNVRLTRDIHGKDRIVSAKYLPAPAGDILY